MPHVRSVSSPAIRSFSLLKSLISLRSFVDVTCNSSLCVCGSRRDPAPWPQDEVLTLANVFPCEEPFFRFLSVSRCTSVEPLSNSKTRPVRCSQSSSEAFRSWNTKTCLHWTDEKSESRVCSTNIIFWQHVSLLAPLKFY